MNIDQEEWKRIDMLKYSVLPRLRHGTGMTTDDSQLAMIIKKEKERVLW